MTFSVFRVNWHIASVHRDPRHSKSLGVILERKDVINIELLTEDAVEVVDEGNSWIIVLDELLGSLVENRFRNVEDIERRRRSNRRERTNSLAVAYPVQQHSCRLRKYVSAGEDWAIGEFAISDAVQNGICSLVVNIIRVEQCHERVRVDKKRLRVCYACLPYSISSTCSERFSSPKANNGRSVKIGSSGLTGWDLQHRTANRRLVIAKDGTEYGIRDGDNREDIDLHYFRHLFSTQMSQLRGDHDGSLNDVIIKYMRGNKMGDEQQDILDQVYHHDSWDVNIRDGYLENIYKFGLFD